jgi:cytoskeletal protein RodZ
MNNMDVIDNSYEQNQQDTFQLKTLGEFLRFYREQKHFSLEELSFKTKIRIHQLMYLEENDFTKLPNKIYLRGFIKSICNELQISAEMALAYLNDVDFKEETYEFLTPIAPIIPRAHQDKESPRVSYKQREEMSSPYYGPKYFDFSKLNQKLIFGGAAALLLTVTFIGSFQFKASHHVAETNTHKKLNYFEAKKLESGEPVTNLAPPVQAVNEVVVAQNAPVAAAVGASSAAPQVQTPPQGQTQPQAQPQVQMQAQTPAPATVVAQAPVQPKVQTQPATVQVAQQPIQQPRVAQVTPAAVAKPATVVAKPVAIVAKPTQEVVQQVKTQTSPVVKTVAAIPVAETEATVAQTAPAAEKENLKINIVAKKGNVFIVYRVDGGEKLHALIKKGKSMALEGDNIRMNVGNPDAVEITKNGETVNVKPEHGKGSAHLKFSAK